MGIQNKLKRFFAAFGVVLLANIATLLSEVALEKKELSVAGAIGLVLVSAFLFCLCWQGFSPRKKCEKCGY